MDDLTREGPAPEPPAPDGTGEPLLATEDRPPGVSDHDTPHTDGPIEAEDDRELTDEQVLAHLSQVDRTQAIVGWAIALGAALLVFISLSPQLIFTNSTATGGDMGAHVWGPRFLMDHLLPNLRVTGWTPDWYAGFPAYTFYMVVPSLFIVWVAFGSGMWEGGALGIVIGLVVRAAVIAGVVFGARELLRRATDRWYRPLIWGAAAFLVVLAIPVPYNIAFKLVTISGLVTMPIATYLLGRAAKVPFPGPPVLAIASLFFIYDKSFTILGGNGASTMAGEFAFSISLTLSFLYLAVVFRGIRTGRDRALGAVLFGLTILCHLIPAIFAFIVTVVLLFVRREDRTPWWDASVIGRSVAALAVIVTLLTVVPGDAVPVLGGLIDSTFPEWLFPGLASIVALALFTGFEPLPASWFQDPAARRRYTGGLLVVAGVCVTAAAVVGVTPWVWVLLVIAIVLAGFAGIDSRLFRWGVVVGPVGLLLSLFWFVPFYGNSTFMNDMGWEKYTQYREYLLSDPSLDSGGMPYRNLVFALAGLGVLLALVQRVRFGYFMALTVLAFAWIFRYFPQYRLWNARLLPFYYLALYLLAGLAIALVIRSVVVAAQEWRRSPVEPVWAAAYGAIGVAAVALVVMAGAFSWLPGGTPGTDPNNPKKAIYTWAGIDFETTIVHNWAQWNYAGLEGKDPYPEFDGIMDMMTRVADEHGCGRAMWEYEGDLARFGTPMALMLLPYFTDGCVGSMEGLYFESSSTTPFHFLNQSELSVGPSRAQRDLPYSNFDIAKGISHLQMMGVKYYMATTDAAIEAAQSETGEGGRLTEVADETFSYTDSTTGQAVQQRWAVFRVADAELVTPLENEPVVLSDADDHIDGWVYAKEEVEAVEGQPRPPKNPGPAVLWYNDPTRWDVHLATSGPADWQRAPSNSLDMPRTATSPVTVSEIRQGTDSISFRVDQVGEPVLVRASYFPNWNVDGAEGPYRVTPNFMVVVPTQEQVTLSYGRTKWDWLGLLATLLGLAMVGWLMVDDHRRRQLELAGLAAPVGAVEDHTVEDHTVEDHTVDGGAVETHPVDGTAADHHDPEPGDLADTAVPTQDFRVEDLPPEQR